MSGIFISYRRAGASVSTYRLADDLKRAFGEESIFLDVESIDPGSAFANVIQQSLNRSSVALIMIGPEWLTMTDSNGNRRLDDPQDWVRQEVRLALSSRVTVIPVLLEGATMPNKAELPEDIRELAGLNSFPFSPSPVHWSYDAGRLADKISEIDKRLGKKRGKKTGGDNSKYSSKALWGLGIGLLFGIYILTEGWVDSEEAAGYMVFFIIGLGLSIFGFKDIRNDLAKGKGVAAAGILVCGCGLLGTIAGLALEEAGGINSATLEPAIHTPPEPIEKFIATAPPSTSSNTPTAPKPSAEPKQPTAAKPAAPIPQFGGMWRTPEGVVYQVFQQGKNISFVEYNVFGAAIGEGQGVLQGNRFSFDYYNSLFDTSATGVGQLNGNTVMLLNFTDAFNNSVSFQAYRQ